ncbi:MAG: hypothetical protein JW829_05340, partial [Pirellulales bacterium]|nr:hypothetical protein [Pirellulales bacterium]
MRSKRIWFWSLTSVWGILASCITVADDHSDRMMHLKNALASIEREEEIAADSGNTGAKTLLSEVHQNIAMTIADIEADEPIAETAPQIATHNLLDLDHPLNRAKYALIQQPDRLEIPSASKVV